MKSMLYSVFILTFILFYSKAHSLEVNYESIKSLVEKHSANINVTNTLDGIVIRSFTPELEIFAAQESFKEGNKTQQSQPMYGAEVKVNIFNGTKVLYDSKVRESQINNKRFTYQRTKTARETYWKYIYTIESIKLINEMMELNSKSLKSAQQRINAGVASQTDRYEFELKAIDLKQRLKEVSLSSENLKRQIIFLLNIKPTQDLTITGALEHDHDYKMELSQNQKDYGFLYQEEELAKDVEKLKENMPRGLFVPKVDLYASYKQQNQLEIDMPNSEDRVERVAGLKMTLNLNEAFENQRQAKASLFEATALVKRAQFQKRDFQVHVENETLELDLLHSQVHDSDLSVEIANKYFKTTLNEYARGVKNSSDVLSVSEKLFETRNKKLEIIRDFQIAKSNILSMVGQ